MISQNALVKIDPSIPFEVAALFGCAVVTGVGSVVNTAKIGTGQSVAIVGLGGVGLNSLLASIASGAGKVIVVDVNEKKLIIASQLGAHYTFNSTLKNCTEQILDLTDGGVHYAFEAAGVPPALDLAYQITKRGGMTIVAGMPGPEAKITLSHLSLSAEERIIKGSYMGSCVPNRDIPRYIDLYKNESLPVDKLIGERFSFGGLNEALDRLDKGEALRQILIF